MFCLLLLMEAVSPQNLLRCLKKWLVSWREVRLLWQMRQNFIAQFIQLLKLWLCDMQPGTVLKKNLALAVDQHQLQALQFLAHLINFLNILLKCNAFAWIHKDVVDEKGSRWPNRDHDPFWCSLALGCALERLLGPTTELVIPGCHTKSTCHHTSQSNWEMVHCHHTE